MGACVPCPAIHSRGQVNIVYSSTTGTAKKTAFKLEQILNHNLYHTSVANIGDVNENILLKGGIVVFMLATYHDGSSPSDGKDFLQWIESLQQQQFDKLNYCVLAFGSSFYEKYCGFGSKTAQVIKNHKGKELLKLTKCDSASTDKNVDAQFMMWSKDLIQVLNSNFQVRQLYENPLIESHKFKIQKIPNFKWEQSARNHTNLCKQFSNYLNMHKCRVIHIKQIRRQTPQIAQTQQPPQATDNRSTLWVRLQINGYIGSGFKPGCNINVFPLNVIDRDPNDYQVVTFSELKGKIVFPPMPLGEIKKRVNYIQTATKRHIKSALAYATASLQIKSEYQKMLQNDQDPKIQCKKLVQDLKPTIQFLAELGLNPTRTSTLASWDYQSKHFDICVSLVKNGLFSNYLQSNPKYISISPITSMFTVPENRPMVMIANGAGIAPFRSIVQYCVSNQTGRKFPIRLYFGIQNKDIDFYFGDQWQQLQKKGIVELRIAQSRRQSRDKEYVQHLLNEDKVWLSQHLLAHQGVIFICGGSKMSKPIQAVVVESLKLKRGTSEETANDLLSEMKKNKTIVQEVYG